MAAVVHRVRLDEEDPNGAVRDPEGIAVVHRVAEEAVLVVFEVVRVVLEGPAKIVGPILEEDIQAI